MMTLREITAAAAALGNQLAAGIPLDQALRRLTQIQPAHAEFWSRALASVQAGRLLSESLSDVWPETLVGVVKAGERAGRLDQVFGRIEETIELQLRLRAAVSKLGYPLGVGLAGLAVFIGFMVFVLPTLSKSLGTRSHSAVFELSTWMANFAHDNWVATVAAAAGATVLMLSWLRTKEGQATVLSALLGIPMIRGALGDLYFGLWANYMAMVVSAGITTTEGLKMTAVVLPSGMDESVLAFERDLSVNHRTMAESVDPRRLPADDPRAQWWPYYIANAFIVAEQTGAVDHELLRVAPALIKEGLKKLDAVINIGYVVALTVAAAFIVSPLAAYYIEIFAAVQQAGR